MDFAFTEAQEAFRAEFRAWLEDALPEGWVSGDRALPEDEDERVSFLRDWQRTLAEDGWAGPSWPEEYGGLGLSAVEQVVYEDELARVDAPPKINSIAINFVGPGLIEVGSDWQKERFVPHMLDGEEIWSLGYSEPDHGSDVAGLETRAEREGDEWVIEGGKIWTTNAHVADWYLLMTRTDFSGTKHEGITAIIVDMDQDAIQPERLHQISDDRSFNQVFIDGARAPADHVVGEVGRGWDVIRAISAYEQSGRDSAYAVRRRLSELVQYCRSNTRAGRPLAEYPTIRRKLAEFDARVSALMTTKYRLASDRIDDPIPGPEGTIDQLTADELAIDLDNFAMDLLGPEATLWYDGPEDGRWAHDYLQNYGTWIGGGTGDIYRNIIGEQVLRLPKDIKSETTHRGG